MSIESTKIDDRFRAFWGDTLEAVSYDSSLTVEALYQAFKARLMRELVAHVTVQGDAHGPPVITKSMPLADRESGVGG